MIHRDQDDNIIYILFLIILFQYALLYFSFCTVYKKSVSLVAQTVKNLPAMQETWVRSLGWEDSLEKGMATHSCIPAWRTPRTESLVGYSPWGCKELDTTKQLNTHTHRRFRKEN